MPMAKAASRPPAGRGRDDHRPAAAGGVDGGDRRPEDDPGQAAGQGQQQRLGQELAAHVALCRAEARRRPISGRRSSTEITMTLAIPTPPTSRATAPSPSRSEVKRCWRPLARPARPTGG